MAIAITPLGLEGCFLIEAPRFEDARGHFSKPFVASEFVAHGLRTDFVEQYYSTSGPQVIRGMHFQVPPFQHAKLVYCARGAVTDVLLDLRTASQSHGESFTVELDAAGGKAVYIAPGIAHGFVCRTAPALMVYNVTSEYSQAHDCGIHWNSFGFDWAVTNPIVSERDAAFETLGEFRSPF